MNQLELLIRPRQVVISRLRPYLRQVAWVDAGLLAEQTPGTELICSTEFFVLESVGSASVAFLVPFLLSLPIQAVLAAAQAGGHHPRFNERTLMTLPIPPRSSAAVRVGGGSGLAWRPPSTLTLKLAIPRRQFQPQEPRRASGNAGNGDTGGVRPRQHPGKMRRKRTEGGPAG